MEGLSGESCGRKAFEISYALFRIAAVSPNKGFSQYLEHYALELLDAAVSGNYHKAEKTSAAVDYFIRLGASVGLLSFQNSQILGIETKNFLRLLHESMNTAKEDGVSLEGSFSDIAGKEEGSDIVGFKHEDQNAAKYPAMQDKPDVIAGFSDAYPVHSHNNGNGQSENAAEIRQKEILEKIRQNNNCRLKDLQESFPDISERTLRYDIQRLIEQKEVERVGSGGPGTFYRTYGAGVAHGGWEV